MTSLYTYPRMQVIRATDMCDGLIVESLPSLRSSASSWFNVTNSASIATMSPVTEQFDNTESNKSPALSNHSEIGLSVYYRVQVYRHRT